MKNKEKIKELLNEQDAKCAFITEDESIYNLKNKYQIILFLDKHLEKLVEKKVLSKRDIKIFIALLLDILDKEN